MLPEKLRTVAPSSSNAFLLPARISALFMNPSRPMIPGRMTSRPRYMFCTGLRWGASARSWYTVSIPRWRAESGPGMVTGLPSTRISPEVGVSVPDRILTSVLLPAPLSPMSATTSPVFTSKLAPDSALT